MGIMMYLCIYDDNILIRKILDFLLDDSVLLLLLVMPDACAWIYPNPFGCFWFWKILGIFK